ncbi:helix-turn-helix domain-containing protein [Streptomyces albidoflavus]
MAPWKALPEHLDPQAGRLVDRLRRLKDATGLSFTALATRTSYSRSSWERYLNGRKLPPAEAVTELAALAGADPDRMLALHTLAAQTWTGPQTKGPAAPGTSGAEPEPTEPAWARLRARTRGRPGGRPRPRPRPCPGGAGRPRLRTVRPHRQAGRPGRARPGEAGVPCWPSVAPWSSWRPSWPSS